jgi:effector-binding domain-containing protein
MYDDHDSVDRAGEVAGVESPQYDVVEVREDYEIRQYPRHIVAEVTVEGEFKRGMNQGFRTLAAYIFGDNRAPGESGGSGKIEMTAPVQERVTIAMTAPVQETENEETGSRVVGFIMPSEYTMESLPKPTNPEIRLVEVPSRTYAVLRFSGFVPEEKAVAMKQKLVELTKTDGLRTTGEPILNQYNPLWTPPFMRRNEVWLELDQEDAGATPTETPKAL